MWKQVERHLLWRRGGGVEAIGLPRTDGAEHVTVDVDVIEEHEIGHHDSAERGQHAVEAVEELLTALVERRPRQVGGERAQLTPPAFGPLECIDLRHVATDRGEEPHPRTQRVVEVLHIGDHFGALARERVDERGLALPGLGLLQRRPHLLGDLTPLLRRERSLAGHTVERRVEPQADRPTLCGVGVHPLATGFGQEHQRRGLFDQTLEPSPVTFGCESLCEISADVQPVRVDAALVGDRTHRALAEEGRAVGAAVGHLCRGCPTVAMQLGEPCQHVGVGRFGEQHRHRLADHLGRAEPGLFLECCIHVDDRWSALVAASGGRHDDRITCGVECSQQQPGAWRTEAGQLVGAPVDVVARLRRRWCAAPGQREQRQELLDGSGASEVVALRLIGTHSDEGIHLGNLFDAFRDHAQAERVRQIDDGFDDRLVRERPADAGDELPVDLHCSHRQLAKVRQRRVAGAEIVEGDLDAQFAQLLEQPDGARKVFEQT